MMFRGMLSIQNKELLIQNIEYVDNYVGVPKVLNQHTFKPLESVAIFLAEFSALKVLVRS